mmetsp:Transcript_2459/g.5779  ORF Transcript_2459/g.5779 Transcript_2459/m.5779 type:complete len:201 (+) Transcript_2459:837-1439(+)
MRSNMLPTKPVSSSLDMPCTSSSSACRSTSVKCCSNRFFAYMPWMICKANGINSSYSIIPSAFMSASAKKRSISSLGKSSRCCKSSIKDLNSAGSRNWLPSLSYFLKRSWMIPSTSSSDMSSSSAAVACPASTGRPLAKHSKYLAANSWMFSGWERRTSRVKSLRMSGNSGGTWYCFANLLDMAAGPTGSWGTRPALQYT